MNTLSHESKEKINGVFSSQEVKKVGTGTTTRKSIVKTLWFVIELDDEQVEIQPINPNFIPSGPKKTIDKNEFLTSFSPEPEVYVSEVYPKMRELNKVIARAERHRASKELFSAEMEYNNALVVDEENVRANFGLGITYLERGENDKAENIFDRLVKLDAAFENEHKHLFNEFGISLRKSGMLDQAVSYYTKALELADKDEHLYYNMARVFFEKQDIENTIDQLLKSLEVNPRLEPSVKFLMWLISQNLVPEARKADMAQAITIIKEAAQKNALDANKS